MSAGSLFNAIAVNLSALAQQSAQQAVQQTVQGSAASNSGSASTSQNALPILMLDSLILPPDLLWVDEFDWTPTEQKQSRTLTGAVVFETAARQGGRPMTLQGGQYFGWIDRATLSSLYDKLAVNTALVLILQDGRTFNVRFRHEDKPIDARAINDYRVMDVGDVYQLTLKLIQVE